MTMHCVDRGLEMTETGRRVLRSLIEQAFPGVNWSMIESAFL